MSGRIDFSSESNSHATSVIFRAPPNWTAVAFFGALGGLHLGMAATAFFAGRWEAHLSMIFGCAFLLVSLAFALVHRELAIAPQARRILLRTGLGRYGTRRSVPFSQVLSVRVTLFNCGPHHESNVTISCRTEDLELPPTRAPRQTALLLVMTLGVRLVKIYGDDVPSEPSRRIAKLLTNDESGVGDTGT